MISACDLSLTAGSKSSGFIFAAEITLIALSWEAMTFHTSYKNLTVWSFTADSNSLHGPSFIFFQYFRRLQRCWWRMLETKFVIDGFGHSGHQHSKDVTNIEIQLPTSTHRQQHHCHLLDRSCQNSSILNMNSNSEQLFYWIFTRLDIVLMILPVLA